MFVCNNCNHTSERDELVLDRGYRDSLGVPEEPDMLVCPHCGSAELSTAVQCMLCEEWVDEYEVSDIHLCSCCSDDTRETLYLKIAQLQEQIEVLHKEFLDSLTDSETDYLDSYADKYMEVPTWKH